MVTNGYRYSTNNLEYNPFNINDLLFEKHSKTNGWICLYIQGDDVFVTHPKLSTNITQKVHYSNFTYSKLLTYIENTN